MNDTFAPNADEYETVKKIANSGNDGPVLMINIKQIYTKCRISRWQIVQRLHEGFVRTA